MPSDVSETIHDLTLAARKLAILGAALKQGGTESLDPAVRRLLERGVELILGERAPDLPDADSARLATAVEMAFAESADLFRQPDRGGAWNVEDPELLHAFGRASRGAFDRILWLAGQRSALRDCLNGRFLDVGTGVGGIALRAADACPGLEIDGIDIWEPALRLAREAVAASPHHARVRISHGDVAALEAGARYTLVWLPTMFMRRPVLDVAIARIAAASQPGAWLVAALYTAPSDPLAAVIADLRTLRGGGDCVRAHEVASLLSAQGYRDLEIDTSPLSTFVLGRLG